MTKPTLKQRLKVELQRLKDDFRLMVANYARAHPTMTYEEIAIHVGLHKAQVVTYCNAHGVKRTKGAGSTAAKPRRKK